MITGSNTVQERGAKLNQPVTSESRQPNNITPTETSLEDALHRTPVIANDLQKDLEGNESSFKPLPLRMWYLGSILVVLLLLIGLTELAVNKLVDGSKLPMDRPKVGHSNTTGVTASRMIQHDQRHRSDDSGSLAANNNIMLGNGIMTGELGEYHLNTPRKESQDHRTDYPQVPANKVTNGTSGEQVYAITQGQYILGLIIPNLIATLLGIPFRIIDCNAKLYQPFHALAVSQSRGASASQSLLFETKGPTTSLRAWIPANGGQGLIRLTGFLVLLSAILVPVSGEAIRITVQGSNCHIGCGTAQNCAITLGKFPVPARIVVAILAIMAVALIATGCLLKGWKTGVSSSSWNLMAMSQLSRHPELQYLLCNIHEQNGKVQPSEISKLFEDNRYTFGWWNDRGSLTYGALVLDQHGASSKPMRRERPDGSSLENGGTSAPPKRPRMPTFILTVVGRLLILFLLIGLSIHISIYPGLRHTNDGFADFVDSESIGVQILFSGAGVIITMYWTSFFQYCALLTPYKTGVENSKSANKVGEFDPSTNPFSALARTVCGRQSDLYLGMVAVMSIVSEFLPTLLANVPHRVIETYIAHFICMWHSVALLILMALTIIGSFFVKWPHMPIDPTTLIGAMYYVVPRTPSTLLPREL